MHKKNLLSDNNQYVEKKIHFMKNTVSCQPHKISSDKHEVDFLKSIKKP